MTQIRKKMKELDNMKGRKRAKEMEKARRRILARSKTNNFILSKFPFDKVQGKKKQRLLAKFLVEVQNGTWVDTRLEELISQRKANTTKDGERWMPEPDIRAILKEMWPQALRYNMYNWRYAERTPCGRKQKGKIHRNSSASPCPHGKNQAQRCLREFEYIEKSNERTETVAGEIL